MISDVTLYVRTRVCTGKDRLGNKTYGFTEPLRLLHCLYAPGAPANLGDDRPEGVSVKATAYIPRDVDVDFRRAQVSFDGKLWLTVIGEPLAYPAGVIPSGYPWDTQLLLGDTDG